MPTAHGVSTSAGSAILMEAESGRVLYEQDAGRPRLIASVTKLMTALVALESGCPLEEKVVIREEDTRTEGSSLYLRPGEELRLETLLYGLLLQSGNDAAWRWPALRRDCGEFCRGDEPLCGPAGHDEQPLCQSQRPERGGALLHRPGTWPCWPGPV